MSGIRNFGVAALVLVACSVATDRTWAEEKAVTGKELQEILGGRTAIDVSRADHWFKLKANGTAVVASRGIEFPTTYESTDTGWCRTMAIPAGAKVNKQRFKKVAHRCQSIRYDGEHIVFLGDDGKPTNKYRIE